MGECVDMYMCACVPLYIYGSQRAVPTFYPVWNRCHQAISMSFWRCSWCHLCLIMELWDYCSYATTSQSSWILRIQTQAPIFAQQAFTHYAILPVPAVAFWFPFVCVYFAACAFSVKYKKSLPSPTVWWLRCFPQRIRILGLMLMSLILSKLTFVYDIRYRFNFILLNAFSLPSPINIYIHILLSTLNIFVKKHLTICDHLLSKWRS